MNRALLAFVTLAVMAFGAPVFGQDARMIVEDAQRRTTSSSQRHEGTLRVISQKNKITEKRWTFVKRNWFDLLGALGLLGLLGLKKEHGEDSYHPAAVE